MFAFFRCVAEAVVEKGAKGLAGLVPGGPFAVAVAESAWKRYRGKVKDAELRAEMQKVAAATFEEAKAAAADATRAAMADAPPEDRLNLEMFLAQIPAAVKQSLKRSDDPTGLTVPPAFALESPDDVLKLLPARVPKFRPGDPVPGKPGWVLTEQLGVGGFGEVWLAKHPKMASLLGAVKFCHGRQARDLQHEGGLIDRVMQHGDHPNVVPLLDVNLDGDTPWLMFKYVPGGDLADLIREWQATAQEVRASRAVAALRELAAAVGQFHAMSPAVVHRDLKPSNILRCRATGKLRITDFGIGAVTARAALVEESRGGGTRGGRLLSYLRGSHTPLYASPQQRDGHDPDPRDDVHALGVIGYQMLTGNLSQGVGTDFVEDLTEAHADDELIELLRKCTALKADRRPNDATELAERLGRLNSKPVPPPAPPVGTRVKVHCPSCRAAMQAPAAYLGKMVVCPTCKSSFKAAETPGPTTAARHFDISLEGTWHSPAADGDAVATLPGRVTVEPGGRYKVVGSGFGDDLANGLKSLPRVPELKVLDIRWSSLLPANLDALDGFPALDELHLMIYVTDAELPRLAHLPLKTLNLLISPVSDAGLRAVGTFRTLESLDLSQCPNVTSAGVARLVGLSALQNLDLSETKINDAAGAWLAKMPRLRTLIVNGTRMSKSGVDVLRSALPDCAITADDLRVK